MGQRKRGCGWRRALQGIGSGGAVLVGLGLEPEVAGDVSADLPAPVVGDLGQPSASFLQVGATFDVSVPGTWRGLDGQDDQTAGGGEQGEDDEAARSALVARNLSTRGGHKAAWRYG